MQGKSLLSLQPGDTKRKAAAGQQPPSRAALLKKLVLLRRLSQKIKGSAHSLCAVLAHKRNRLTLESEVVLYERPSER